MLRPSVDYPVDSDVHFRLEILLVGVCPEPGDGFADADVKWLSALKVGDEAFHF